MGTRGVNWGEPEYAELPREPMGERAGPAGLGLSMCGLVPTTAAFLQRSRVCECASEWEEMIYGTWLEHEILLLHIS